MNADVLPKAVAEPGPRKRSSGGAVGAALILMAIAILATATLLVMLLVAPILDRFRLGDPEGAVIVREERWSQDEMPWDGSYSADVRMTEAQFHRWVRERGLVRVSGEVLAYEEPGTDVVEGTRANYRDGMVHLTTWW